MTHAVAKHSGDAEDLKESAAAVKDAVVDLATEAGRYAGNRISDAKDSAAAVVDSAKAKAGEYHDVFIGYVRKNPYKALGIAASVGLLAGLMLRRR